jgi:hypothetical protein
MDVDLKFQANKVSLPDNFKLKVFPNPFSENTAIQFDLKADELVEVFVYNLKGELVFSESNNFSKGFNKVELESSVFKQNGIYFAQLKIGNKVFQSERIILLK